MPRYDEMGRAVETYAPAINGQTGASLGITEYGISTASGFVGTYVLTTDAAGKKGRAITNALGQLIRVDEPDYAGGLDPLPQSTPNPTPTPNPSPSPGGGGGCLTPENCLPNLTGSDYPMNPTIYKYNEQGKMVEVIQGDQHRYFKYDSLGRLIRVRQPEQDVNSALNLSDSYNTSGQWTAAFSYDVLGNVLTATDANGTQINYTYDKASRVKTRTYSNEPNGVTTPAVSFYYDGKGLAAQQSPNYAKGKLTKVTSSVSESRYTQFDYLGRLLESQQITDGQTYTSSYEYNLSGALTKQTYPNGREVMNAFESDGDLARIYGKATANSVERTYANSSSYTPDGRIEKLRLGNSRWEWAKFNERLQVTELNLGSGVQDASLWKLKYEYGEINSSGDVDTTKNTGNIARLTTSFSGLSNPFVQTFKYDSLYRLVEAKEKSGANENWKELFSYDRYGNRIGYEKYLNVVQQTLDNKTHPTINPQTNRFNTGQGYTYDFNGNLVIDAEARNFTFNGDNKQSEIRNGTTLLARYFYDGEGKRVRKKVYNPTGTVKEETVFVYDGLGKLIAEYSTAIPPPNPTTSYTATDMLGSPRVITNSQGEVVSRRDFQPFGEELANDPNYRTAALKYNTGDGIRQKFTGYLKDEETGLDFAEARMYENRHARFTAVDPLLASGKSANPQSFNRYVYVMNNPLAYTDPTGLQTATNPNGSQTPSGIVFDFYIRSFAPYDWFGETPWFAFAGDGNDRGFSTSLDASVTSRMVGHVRVDTSKTNIRDWIWRTEVSRSEILWYGDSVAGGEDSECYITPMDPTGDDYGTGRFGFNLAGNNDAFPIGIGDYNLSMDIDLNASPRSFGFNVTQGFTGQTLTINGPVTGDQFPAAEIFLRDLSGNSVFLGVFSIPEGANPYSNLPGNNYRPMIFVNDVNIGTNSNGEFQWVVSQGQTYTIEEWNRRFTNQRPKPPEQE